jgi:hypothetical protein
MHPIGQTVDHCAQDPDHVWLCHWWVVQIHIVKTSIYDEISITVFVGLSDIVTVPESYDPC